MSAKRTITKEQFWQAVGILCIGQRYVEKLEDIEKALSETLGIEHEAGGHCGDAIYNNFKIDDLLKRLNLEAEKGDV